jgi:hypothetical protein
MSFKSGTACPSTLWFAKVAEPDTATRRRGKLADYTACRLRQTRKGA